MMKLEKEVLIESITGQRSSNQPYVFMVSDEKYTRARLTVDDKVLESFGFKPDLNLVGKKIMLEVSLINYQESPLPRYFMYLHEVSKTERSRYYSNIPLSIKKEICYQAELQTPEAIHEWDALRCPNYNLTLALTEAEYEEMLKLPAKTVATLRLKIKE